MDIVSSVHEEDSLKDLSVELTVHTEWLNRIHSQGNRPEDWVEFIHHLKEQSPVPVTNLWTAYICDQYVHALKTIPSNQNKNNIMFVKLLIDYATLKSEENVDNGQSLFRQARSIARKFAIAHIYAAEFELKYGKLCFNFLWLRSLLPHHVVLGSVLLHCTLSKCLLLQPQPHE
uniref:Suppressor of forked domain-containing protein n=1 Tax=Octopus bimaculoides TaxID=37653 RepID=A0A0L8FGT1_OCTBM